MSEPPKRRRRTAWSVAAILVGALAVVAAAYALYIHSVADRRWAEMEKSLQELRRETEARNVARPVLRGTPVPGSAWDDYNPVLRAMKGMPHGPVVEFIGRTPKADRAKVEAILATHGPALDGLRKGARRADGIYRFKWEDGFTGDIPGLLQSQNLVNLAAGRSRFLVEEGKPQEAAELLLDAAQFAHDLGYNQVLISEMIAIALYAIVFDELRDLILSGKLSAAELLQVGRELEILDRSFPQHSHSLTNEALAAGFGFAKTNGDVGDLLPYAETSVSVSRKFSSYLLWGILFPKRLTCADAYFVELDFMRRYSALADRPWAELQAAGMQGQAELQKIRNPIARVTVPGLLGSHRAGRDLRAKLRLLRVATHYRATGEILPLDDPFGTKLRTAQSGGKLKVWSVGKDGVDDGGQGQWKPGNGDVVLETDR